MGTCTRTATWPSNWSGFKLDGKGQGSLVEEIELVTECVMKTGY